MATDNIFAGTITCTGMTVNGAITVTGAIASTVGFVGPSLTAISAGAVAGTAGNTMTVSATNGVANTGGAGGAGGNAALTAGVGATGSINGGAGGSSLNSGGAGGATTAAGAFLSGGRGGSAGSAAGDGGVATAGVANGGNGGSVPLQPGVGGASFGGAVGTAGIVFVAGTSPMPFVENHTISALGDTAEIVSIANMRGGIWTVAIGGSDRIKTTPSAAAIVSGFPSIQVGSTIDIVICNLKAANIVTLAGGANVTAAAGTNLVVAAQAAVTFKLVATNVTAATEAFTIIRAAG